MTRGKEGLQYGVLLGMAILVVLSLVVSAVAYIASQRRSRDNVGGGDAVAGPRPLQPGPGVANPNPGKGANAAGNSKPRPVARDPVERPVPGTGRGSGKPVVLEVPDKYAMPRICPDCAGFLDDPQHRAIHTHFQYMASHIPEPLIPEKINPPVEAVEVDPPPEWPDPIEASKGKGFAPASFRPVVPEQGWAALEQSASDGEAEINRFGDLGQPAAVKGLLTEPLGRDPLSAARAFLDKNRDFLRIDTANLAALRVSKIGAGNRVVFGQFYRELRVVGTDVVVDLDPANRVLAFVSDYAPRLQVETQPSLASTQALDLAMRAAAEDLPGQSMQLETQELVILPTWDSDKVVGTLAWRVVLSAAGGLWYRVDTDAHKGRIVARETWSRPQ